MTLANGSGSEAPRILVPLDESEVAERALPIATRIAKGAGGRISLLTVPRALGTDMSWYYEAVAATPSTEGSFDSVDDIVAESAAEAGTYLAGVAERLRGDVTEVDTTIAETPPGAAIVDAAEELDADLIVLATHGRGGVGRWALGSVASKLLQTTNRPVLLVRAGPEIDLTTLARIDVALDGSEEAERILPMAVRMARWMAMPLRLLHVMPQTHERVDRGMIGAQATYLKSAEDYLTRVEGELDGEGLVVTHHIVTGDDAAEALLSADHNALLALTSHGRGGVSRWMFGSVADRIVRNAELPVLVQRLSD